MRAVASEPLGWSRVRWWTTIFFVAAAQVAAIALLSKREAMVPRRPDFITTFRLAGNPPPGSPLAEWLKIEDPTLLALPDPRGFSGAAWMRVPPVRHEFRDWTEPSRWLALPAAELGAAFAELTRTNLAGPPLLPDKPAPRLSAVPLSPVPLRVKSTFRIEGDLARRELATPLEIPSLPHGDILTNTVVQVCVGQAGLVFSPVPLSSSGSKTADQTALDLVKAIRFTSVAPSDSSSSRDRTALTWGKIIFQWHTLELTATNGPAARHPP